MSVIPDPVEFAPGPTSRYQWVASGPNPCRRCAELDGQVRSLDAWQTSVNPGFHDHCHCFLLAVDLPDTGWAFTDQFTHIAAADFLACVAAMFRLPEPDHGSKRHSFEEPEGAEDLQPGQVDNHHYDPRNHPGAKRSY